MGGLQLHLSSPQRTTKKVIPQMSNLFTTVPPSSWLAAGGGRKNWYIEVVQKGVGQFGEYFASQFGEEAKSVNLANFSEACQSGDTAKAVN